MICVQTVLSTFEAQPLGGDDDESIGYSDEGDNTAFKIKYLTSSKLMSLEVYPMTIELNPLTTQSNAKLSFLYEHEFDSFV